MQCFGGCFAPSGVRNEFSHESVSGKVGVGASFEPDALSTADQVGYLQQTTPGSNGRAASGIYSSDSLKSKLRKLSRSSSSQLQSEGSTYSCSSWTTEEDKEQLRQQFLLQHGRHIMSISTLQQEGLQHFVLPGIGYIAYGLMHNGPEFLNARTAVALSDPVCAVHHYGVMAEAFLKVHPKAMFAQVTAEFAAVLQDVGFTINSMGGETCLDVASYNFTGYARRGLRSAIASATKEGIMVEEVMQPAAHTLGRAAGAVDTAGFDAGMGWSGLVAEMQEVDAKWASGKGGRVNEVWFINRRPIFAPEPGVRKFIARNAAGQLQGYIFFDGVFEGGRLVGYYANVTRMLPDAHPGTLNLMMKTFLERIRAEAQLAAPAKKLSMKRSQRKKQQAAGAGPTDLAAHAAVGRDQDAGGSDAAVAHGPKFLSLGLSPFHQMDNSQFNACKTTQKLLQMTYDDGEGFYPFKTLAAAKAKYGAGLHNGKYEDSAVEYKQMYLCHRRGGGAMVSVFDLGKFFGLWKHPADFFAQYLSHKVKRRLQKQDSTPLRKTQSGTYIAGAHTLGSTSSSTLSTGVSSTSLKRSKSCPVAPTAAVSKKGAAASGVQVGSSVDQQKQERKKSAKAAAATGGAAGLVMGGAGVLVATEASSLSGGKSSLIRTATNPPEPMFACSEGGSDIPSSLAALSSTPSGDSPRMSSSSGTSSPKLIDSST